MWQKLSYICNNFFYYNNLSIIFLNYCTIETRITVERTRWGVNKIQETKPFYHLIVSINYGLSLLFFNSQRHNEMLWIFYKIEGRLLMLMHVWSEGSKPEGQVPRLIFGLKARQNPNGKTSLGISYWKPKWKIVVLAVALTMPRQPPP